MAKGIVAFVVVTALIISLSVLSGLGFYTSMGVDYSTSSSEDVRAAGDTLVGQNATDRGSGSALEDFTASAGTSLATAWQVISNLSGILQLLTPLPAILTDWVQRFFMIGYGITFAGFIRGVVF